MNKEAIRKMKLARKHQKEAFMELIPEKIRGNVENIEKEMKEIMVTCFMSSGLEFMQAYMATDASDEVEKATAPDQKAVKKVDIS